MISLGGSTIEEGLRAARLLLERPDPPTALFTVNNFMTAGAIMAVRELGLRMPDELALVGFDDLDWTTLVEPPITVVAQPVAELGRVVGQRLLDRLGGDDVAAARAAARDDARRARLVRRLPMSREATELVSTLVALDSTNPQLVPGGAGEGPVARHLAARLEAAGLELDVWDVAAGPPERRRDPARHGRRPRADAVRPHRCRARQRPSSSGPSCATGACTAAAPST